MKLYKMEAENATSTKAYEDEVEASNKVEHDRPDIQRKSGS